MSDATAPKTLESLGELFSWNIYIQGLTQSLISTFRDCERKFRLNVQGISSMRDSQALIYGSVFHEALDVCQSMIKRGLVTTYDGFDWVAVMEMVMACFEKEYVNASFEGKTFYETCYGWAEVTLPLYFEYWQQDFFGDTKKEFIEIEKEFAMPYESPLHKGKTIPIRGKRDGVVKQAGKLWLWENKTKGQWNEFRLSMVVERDLQNNTYLMSLDYDYPDEDIEGVIYNLIRRPSLKRRKAETMPEFLERCRCDIAERPDFYFDRLEVEVTQEHRAHFRQQFKRQVELIERYASDILPSSPFMDIENTSQCDGIYGMCSYLMACTSMLKDFTGLYVKEELFSELEDANHI